MGHTDKGCLHDPSSPWHALLGTLMAERELDQRFGPWKEQLVTGVGMWVVCGEKTMSAKRARTWMMGRGGLNHKRTEDREGGW